MKTVKSKLTLALLVVVFWSFSGCSGGGGGTPNPTPVASPGYTIQEIDFTDDFSDSQSGWGQQGKATDGDAMYYADTDGDGSVDGYIMQLYGTPTAFAVPYINKMVNDESGYTIEVSIKNILDARALGGVYFSDNGVNHNVFVINPKKQEYAVAQEHQGGMNWNAMRTVINTTKSDVIKANDFNILKVEVIGSLAKFSINGQQVGEITTVPVHPAGEVVGLYLSNGMDSDWVQMCYDDFHVTGTAMVKN